MPDRGPALSTKHPPAVLPLVHPLDEFYFQAGRELPVIEALSEKDVPEPYKRLLVHDADMTSTLESFHGGTIHIRALGRHHRGDQYFREVILLLDNGRVLEYGANKMNLALFPASARRILLEEHEPLGHVLNKFSIQYTSRPKAFLKIYPDAFICSALSLAQPAWLYGRRNTLYDSQQRPLAEIVEILPPEA